MIDFEERCQQRHESMGLDCHVAAAVIGGVTSLVGAGISAYSGNEQANATERATADANRIQQQEYQQQRDDQAPYRDAGYGALKTITDSQTNHTGFDAPFNFTADPGYQFTLDQGNKAIQSSAAARGGSLNGGTLKALGQYTTGLANTTYGSAYQRYLDTSNMKYNQLATVAGLGQTSLNSTAQTGTNYANQTAQNTISGASYAGAQRASGYAGLANGLGQAASFGYSGYKLAQAGGGFHSSQGNSGSPYSDSNPGAAPPWWEE